MRKTILIAAAAAALLAGGPAFAKTDVCIRHDDIRNWTALNDRQVVMENYHHQKALLELLGPCSGLQFHEALAIRSPGSTQLSCIETGDEILVQDMGMRQRCVIRKITAYAGDMHPHPYVSDKHDGDHHDDHDGDNH